jgi:hypothetical protein
LISRNIDLCNERKLFKDIKRYSTDMEVLVDSLQVKRGIGGLGEN